MTPREFYDNSIRHLPATDRLRLASLILEDLADSSGEAIDVRDDWSEEDIADLTAASLKHGIRSIASEGEDA